PSRTFNALLFMSSQSATVAKFAGTSTSLFREKLSRTSLLLLLLLLAFVPSSARADAIDDNAALPAVLDEALLDLHGERWNPEIAAKLEERQRQFGEGLTSPDAQALWSQPLENGLQNPDETARHLGVLQARLQHV